MYGMRRACLTADKLGCRPPHVAAQSIVSTVVRSFACTTLVRSFACTADLLVHRSAGMPTVSMRVGLLPVGWRRCAAAGVRLDHGAVAAEP